MGCEKTAILLFNFQQMEKQWYLKAKHMKKHQQCSRLLSKSCILQRKCDGIFKTSGQYFYLGIFSGVNPS